MAILLFILVLLVLIVGHELGHFFAAKSVKMKVLEFGVGFPPKIFGKKLKEDGTEYTVNWLPFGGFVRIFGEDPKDADKPGAFHQKHPLAQAYVLFAGPGANIVLAFVLSVAALTVGAQTLVNPHDDTAVVKNERVYVAEVLAESPADVAGILQGDTIVSIQTSTGLHAIETPQDINTVVNATEDERVSVTVLRNEQSQVVFIEPELGLIEHDTKQRALGVATALVGEVSYPLHIALVKAVESTARNFVFILVSIIGLIGNALTLSADVSQIAGPVGIASLTGEAAAFGLGSLLSFAALLSINLAIVNLLPFPALDGGRLLFLGIESVTRKKIPINIAGLVNTIGFALLILLMVAVTIGDIGRLVG